MKKCLLLIMAAVVTIGMLSCSSTKFVPGDNAPKTFKVGDTYLGKASYYDDLLHGQVTASGDYYDLDRLTAAHRTFPFGTVVRVRNLRNNREVTVRINDRGPKPSDRMIDLSKAAAFKLDMVGQGVQEVEIKIIELPNK